MPNGLAGPNEPKVFISYSRRDIEFAQRLLLALEAAGVQAKLDTRDLPALEDWRRELLNFIKTSDTVIFIVSQASIQSPICQWEIEQVQVNGKRLAPVVLEIVDNDDIPDAITRLNYIFFNKPDDFSTNVDVLVKALRTDIVWIKEHTRLSNRADLWIEKGRPDSFTLRGAELTEYDLWLSKAPSRGPKVTENIIEFIAASREAEKAEQSRLRRLAGKAFIEPSTRALSSGNFSQSLEYAIAGAILATDHNYEIVPELASLAIAAAYQSSLRIDISHEGPVQCLAFNTAGTLFVTATNDQTARIWAVTDGSLVAEFGNHSADVRVAKFSPDDRYLLVGLEDGHAYIWHIAEAELLFNLEHHSRPIQDVAYTPDGVSAYTACMDGNVAQWDAQKGNMVRAYQPEELPFAMGANAKFSKDGSRCALLFFHDLAANMSTWSAGVWVLDTVSGKTTHVCTTATSVPPNPEADGCTAFSDDSTLLAVGTKNARIILWDTTEQRQIGFLDGHTRGIRDIEFARGGKLIVSSSEDQTARVWSLKTRTCIHILQGGHRAALLGATFNSDGDKVATWSVDQNICLWDIATSEVLHTFVGHSSVILAVAFSPTNCTIVSISEDGTAKLWTWNHSPLRAFLRRLPRYSRYPDVRGDASDHQSFLALSSEAMAPEIWKLDQGTCTCRLDAEPVRLLVFSPDGSRIITRERIPREDGRGFLWDSATGRKVADLGILYQEYDEDGYSFGDGRLLTRDADNSLCLWDVASGNRLAASAQIDGHLLLFRCCASGPRAVFRRDPSSLAPNNNRSRAARRQRGRSRAKPSELVCICNPFEGDAIVTFESPPWKTDALADINLAGDQLAFVDNSNVVHIYDLPFTTDHKTLSNIEEVRKLQFSPDGKWIVVAATGSFYIVDAARHCLHIALAGFQGSGRIFSCSPDGSLLAALDDADLIWVWRIASGTVLTKLPCFEKGVGNNNGVGVTSIKFSNGGGFITATSEQSFIRCFDVRALYVFITPLSIATLLPRLAIRRGVARQSTDLLLSEAPGNLIAGCLERFPELREFFEIALGRLARINGGTFVRDFEEPAHGGMPKPEIRSRMILEVDQAERLASEGRNDEALIAYKGALPLTEALATAGEDDSDAYKNDLLVLYDRMSRAAAAVGDKATALEFRLKAAVSAKEFADQEPDKPEWRNALVAAYADLGFLPGATGLEQIRHNGLRWETDDGPGNETLPAEDGTPPSRLPDETLPGEDGTRPFRFPNITAIAQKLAEALQAKEISDETSLSEEGAPRFQLPVQGKIILRFGERQGDATNDGVNISVKKGTDVCAAQTGIVAYAGSKLAGCGNMIIIRHEDDWITVYAHNSELFVVAGEPVVQGQVIAKAGSTGRVRTTQVHFELRLGKKPVDPLEYVAVVSD